MVGFINQGDSYKPSFAWCLFCLCTLSTPKARQPRKKKHPPPLSLPCGKSASPPWCPFWRNDGVFCRRKKQGKTWAGWLVVSTHLKNISQIGSFPQVGLKIKRYLKPPPRRSSLHSGWKVEKQESPHYFQISYLKHFFLNNQQVSG